LAAHDAQDCFALCWCRSLVKDGDRFAVTFMDRARPTEDAAASEAIELGVSVVAFVDGNTDNGLAVAVGWQRVELTRATVRAIAMCEISSFNHPRDIVHCGLLVAPSLHIYSPLVANSRRGDAAQPPFRHQEGVLH